MLRVVALSVAVAAVLATAAQAIEWRQSRSLGLPYAGTLVDGVQLPAKGRTFFTWDPVRRHSPNRAGRRWGSDRLVRVVLRVLEEYRRAHPHAPRVAVGDLSRRRGGPFGPKHASHQNGLDVDVYYPRRDRSERIPRTVGQVDRRLAQDLVDRFVRAGASKVFVGPNVGLRGPRGIVEKLWNHDNHLHARLPSDRAPGCRRWVENRIHGYALRAPCAWTVRVRESDGATLLRSRGSLTGRLLHYGQTQPARVGAQLERRGDSLVFRRRGHEFQAVFRFGPRTTRQTRNRTVALVRSVRLTKRAGLVNNRRSVRLLGRSARGRPIRAWRIGNPRSQRKLLIVGCIHGSECSGTAITRRLLGLVRPIAADLWIVQNLNPDGRVLGVRQNGRGVDLNRNFPSQWRPFGRRWDPQYSGPRPLSEPETRLARALIRRIRPDVTIWFHQPQALVRAWGRSIPAARRYARLARVPFRAIRWPAGTAPNWQNHRFGRGASFVVELPPGPLPDAAAGRHERAILRLAS